MAFLQPRILAPMLQRIFPSVFWHHKTSRKVVALTIDDGPTEHTADILKVLNKHGAKATFFILGNNVMKNKFDLGTIFVEGHELANHTLFDRPSIKLSTPVLIEEIQQVDQMIAPYRRPHHRKWFRPGSGWFSPRIIRSAQSLGYSVALGNVYPHDPAFTDPVRNSRFILDRAHEGSVIIVHDRPSTAALLDLVLPELSSRGFSVRTLSDLEKS